MRSKRILTSMVVLVAVVLLTPGGHAWAQKNKCPQIPVVLEIVSYDDAGTPYMITPDAAGPYYVDGVDGVEAWINDCSAGDGFVRLLYTNPPRSYNVDLSFRLTPPSQYTPDWLRAPYPPIIYL